MIRLLTHDISFGLVSLLSFSLPTNIFLPPITCITQGQVPPYAQPQITQFSVHESIIKTVQAIVDGYGLKELSGSDGQVEVKEDVQEICKGYKVGEPIQFTATLNGSFDPEKQRPSAEEEEEEESSSSEEVEAEAEA